MAEHPGVMDPDEYDLSGFCVGVVDRPKMLDPEHVKVGDVLLGLASSGLHSNGYSLARKVLAERGLKPDDPFPGEEGVSVCEVMLRPTIIYVEAVRQLLRDMNVKGMAHITGGGFDENIPRVLRPGQGLEIHEGTWEILPVFKMLEKWGGVPHREMFNIFNMGIGMIAVMDEAEAPKAIQILEACGEKASVIGKVTDKEGVNIILK
jgi:phosphoribosylformylglycinamidine cyclo-ligase